MTIQELYDNMLSLVQKSDAFEYKDHISPGGGVFRIVSYRLAQYSDFLFPGATESRGTMYLLDGNENMVRIAARTPEKFFNAYENPFTMFDASMTIDDVQMSMIKMDGSLISTYMDVDNVLRCKSHSSLSSDHAINSTAIMHRHPDFYNECLELNKLGYTVNMEYTSPVYRIVLPYEKDELTVLNVRHMETGEYMSVLEMSKYPAVYCSSIFFHCGEKHEAFPTEGTLREICEKVQTEFRGIEGFVVRLKSGQHFKIKTNWYCNLHYRKESITIPSRLFTVVLNKQSDDLRQLFIDDPFTLECIQKMEDLVYVCYNTLIKDVEEFVEKNKHLPRKEFAALVISTVPNVMGRQGLIFNLLDGRTPDYAGMMTKNMSDITDVYISSIQG